MTDDDRLDFPTLDYQGTINSFRPWESSGGWPEYRAFLQSEWCTMYDGMLAKCGHSLDGDVESYEWGTFTYCYNTTMDSDLEAAWWKVHRSNIRMIAVHGSSKPTNERRNPSRIRYHGDSLIHEFGETPTSFAWDKGHFAAHTLGGQLDNGLFAQRRDINRGWSERGKVYRAMEKYAGEQPGTLIFSRPIYGDGSEHPFFIEYGVLKDDRQWWVEVFPNRYTYEPFRGFEHAPDWRRRLIPKTAWDAHLRLEG